MLRCWLESAEVEASRATYAAFFGDQTISLFMCVADRSVVEQTIINVCLALFIGLSIRGASVTIWSGSGAKRTDSSFIHSSYVPSSEPEAFDYPDGGLRG